MSYYQNYDSTKIEIQQGSERTSTRTNYQCSRAEFKAKVEKLCVNFVGICKIHTVLGQHKSSGDQRNVVYVSNGVQHNIKLKTVCTNIVSSFIKEMKLLPKSFNAKRKRSSTGKKSSTSIHFVTDSFIKFLTTSLDRFGSYVPLSKDFIEKCSTGSSSSKKPTKELYALATTTTDVTHTPANPQNASVARSCALPGAKGMKLLEHPLFSIILNDRYGSVAIILQILHFFARVSGATAKTQDEISFGLISIREFEDGLKAGTDGYVYKNVDVSDCVKSELDSTRIIQRGTTEEKVRESQNKLLQLNHRTSRLQNAHTVYESFINQLTTYIQANSDSGKQHSKQYWSNPVYNSDGAVRHRAGFNNISMMDLCSFFSIKPEIMLKSNNQEINKTANYIINLKLAKKEVTKFEAKSQAGKNPKSINPSYFSLSNECLAFTNKLEEILNYIRALNNWYNICDLMASQPQSYGSVSQHY